jgi:acyl dehydratase
MGLDPLDVDQLPFVYEDGTPLIVFPTFSTILGWVDMARDPRFANPAGGIDPNRMVVGALGFEILAPLPARASGVARSYFAEVVDKGEGRPALVRVRKDVTIDDIGLAATLDTWMFVRGGGGFGGDATSGPEQTEMPDREADSMCELHTPGNLALLYRLSLGDHNALHADPDHASRIGFERPILHGIASLSIAVHAVLRESLGYEVSRIKGGYARMSGPVFPGDTLRTAIWEESGEILFRSGAIGRTAPVMDGGRIVIAHEAG